MGKETEAGFMKAVQQLAQLCGWVTYHTYLSRGSALGFPDLVLVKPDEPIVFAELKLNGKQPTLHQQGWLALLLQARSCEAYLWRPEDWEAIVSRLGRGMPYVHTLSQPFVEYSARISRRQSATVGASIGARHGTGGDYHGLPESRVLSPDRPRKRRF